MVVLKSYHFDSNFLSCPNGLSSVYTGKPSFPKEFMDFKILKRKYKFCYSFSIPHKILMQIIKKIVSHVVESGMQILCDFKKATVLDKHNFDFLQRFRLFSTWEKESKHFSTINHHAILKLLSEVLSYPIRRQTPPVWYHQHDQGMMGLCPQIFFWVGGERLYQLFKSNFSYTMTHSSNKHDTMSWNSQGNKQLEWSHKIEG
jgi:hypothetical protein